MPPELLAKITAERKRQIGLGFDEAHDNTHDFGELSLAAAAYAASASYGAPEAPELWPWPEDTPSFDGLPQENIVKAIALLVADWERLERIAADPTL